MYGGGAEIKYDAADEDEVIINLIKIEKKEICLMYLCMSLVKK